MATRAALSAPAAALESWIATPEAMHDWVATAKAGEQMTYAQGWHLPRQSAAAVKARKLAEAGYVSTVQRGGPGQIKSYIMQRLRPQRGAIGRALAEAKPRLDGDMARVLRVLRQRAKHGLPCPANRDLAREAKVHNASYVLQKLVEAGVIRNAIVDPGKGARVVTILTEGGIETARPAVRP